MEIAKSPNYLGNSVIFALTTGEGIGPTGELGVLVKALLLHGAYCNTCFCFLFISTGSNWAGQVFIIL